MKLHSRIKRFLAMFLAVIMIVPADTISVIASENISTADETNSSGFNIAIEWGSSEFKKGTSYELYEDSDIINNVKIRVNYSNKKVSETGYKAGELSIVVKGIGNVNRDTCKEATVGADKASADTKSHDWSYTWNKANDTYTFTNNKDIAPNSVMSGYFDLVWSVSSRDSLDEYSQNDIVANMLLPDGSTITSNTLSFSNETVCDVYTTDIERSSLYSANGISEEYSVDDYVFIKFNLNSFLEMKSRGLDGRERYSLNVDAGNVGDGAIVATSTNLYTTASDGAFGVSLTLDADTDEQFVIIAYPRAYVGKTVKATLSSYGTYLNGDDNGNTGEVKLSEDSIEFVMPADFDFKEPDEDVFGYAKASKYEVKEENYEDYVDEVIKKGGHIEGTQMKDGTEQSFFLGFKVKPFSGDGKPYSVQINDDFMYITKMDGTYRQLEAGDYEFTKALIMSVESITNENGLPIQASKYPVKVYAVQGGAKLTVNESTLVWSGLWEDYEQEISLPEGTTAVAIRYENIAEDMFPYTDKISGAVYLYASFHLDEEGFSEKDKADLLNGQVVNTAYADCYDSTGTLITDDFDESWYEDSEINIDLAQKDLDIYGRHLWRQRGAITFYESKNDYSAYTSLSDIVKEGNQYRATMTMGANFDFENEETPDKFSLYTVLPEQASLDGYDIKEDVWNIMSFSGLGVDDEILANHVNAEVVNNYKNSGRTYIALHFDLDGVTVQQDSNIRVKFDIDINKKFFKNSSTLNVRSAVLLDEDINVFTSGKVVDDGAWDTDKSISADMDGDGNSQELLSYRYSSKSYTYADSGEFQISKSVKTDSSKNYVQPPVIPYTEYGSDYSYEILIKNGNGKSSNIILMDKLETGSNSKWKGTFKSIDLSEAIALGLNGTVYYSSKENPSSELSSSDWSTTHGEDVKSIAVDFGTNELDAGEEFNIYVHMTAPSNPAYKNTVTENGFTASFSMVDSFGETLSDTLESNFVQVELVEKLKTVVLTKVDAEDGKPVNGAVFSLIEQDSGKTVSGTTNAKGQIVFKNIQADETYILHEDEAPSGYKPVEDREIVFGEEDVLRLTIKEERESGAVEITKANSLNSSFKVEGAEYTLYTSDGTEVQKGETNASGKLTFTDLAWGSYYFKETKAPLGFTVDEAEYPFEIKRENAGTTVKFNLSDVQDGTTGVTVTKYEMTTTGEKTDIPLSGAGFRLVSVIDGEEITLGTYVTDANGKLVVQDLPYGDFRFVEYLVPVGFEKMEDVEFSISPDNREAELTVYNQRKSGSLSVYKHDNFGNSIEGVVFELFDESKEHVLGTYTSDSSGNISISDLEWGTYYLKEKSTLDYYELNTDWFEVTIERNNLNVDLKIENQTKKGTVILIKVDETDNEKKLEGAEFNLYRADGTVIHKGLLTDANGEIRVENLEWGSYYFKETKAPLGYSLTNETIRFAVNSMNVLVEQSIMVTNPVDEKTITISKRLYADDINFANGEPTFLFKLYCLDAEGGEITYHHVMKFDENYVKENTDADGYVIQTITISGMVAGEYVASEEESSRYISIYAEGIGDNTVVSGNVVKIDVRTEDEGGALFMNEKYEHGGFSDNKVVVNSVKAQVKLTGLKVTWLGDEEVQAKTAIDRSLIKVIALYDDGTTKILADDAYTLSDETFPNANGAYNITVSYTENGITKTADFTISILAEYSITYVLNGGVQASDAKETYTMKDSFSLPKPTRTGYTFSGWYTQADFSSGLLSEISSGTGDLVLYAKWYPEAGLFNDKGELVASWSSLTNDYGFNPSSAGSQSNSPWAQLVASNTELKEGTQLIIGDVTSIGAFVFRGASLKRIIIPETVRTIGKNAFATVFGITDIYFEQTTQVSCQQYSFYYNTNMVLHFKNETVSNYLSGGWHYENATNIMKSTIFDWEREIKIYE